MEPDTTPAGPRPPLRRRLKWPGRRILRPPRWVARLDAWMVQAVPFHPTWLSAARLLVVAPMLLLALRQVRALPTDRYLVAGLFVLYACLDYLDGLAARKRRLEEEDSRLLDRIAALPLLLALCTFCWDRLPTGLMSARVGLEVVLIVLFLVGRGRRRSGRLRTGLEYTTLLAMLLFSQGWAPRLLSERVVTWLLTIDVAFTSVVVLNVLRVLQKRFIADALSAANLLAGVASIRFAFADRFDLALLFLMIGGTFDGFDGAAARRWGGTRFGVYSDDLADAVNFGLAPAVAVWLVYHTWASLAVGAFYLFFTWGRLVFFTLNKAYADPGHFSGVPSPAGALLTMCGVVLFQEEPLLLGLVVGVACVLMFSFDTNYRHVGRALGSNRRAVYGMPAFLLSLVLGYVLWGVHVPVTIMLVSMLLYGFLPAIARFRDVGRRWREDRRRPPGCPECPECPEAE
ncbi:MAG: CDP-alcohol phosphatidyltransferase family protein [Pseudomonadota bacterium]